MGQIHDTPLAITGIGVYSPLGASVAELWQRIRAGECGVREIQGFPTDGLSVRHAAEIITHRPDEHFDNADERALDWTAQFGIIAARQALHDAALEESVRTSQRIGLVVGVCAGGQGIAPPDRNPADPFDIALDTFPDTAIYKQTDAIGKSLQIHGPRSTVSTACASSGSALGYAYDLLQTGKADVILAGGTDAFSISTYAGFYALGAMPPAPISPFSENIGVSFGEGAGFVVLERLADAQARGAKIYGLFLGHGGSGDAHHVTAPHPSGEGLCRAMNSALKRAKLNVTEVDYVNAHGTGTRDNDKAETSAIRELFQSHKIPPVSSTKSQLGHTLGAAGVLEFIVAILAQRESLLPPTANFVSARPGCDLDYVPNEARPAQIRSFLSNSAAFGGINVSLVGGSPAAARPAQPRERDELWLTGVGVVSPVGCGREEFRRGLIEKRSGIKRVEQFDVTGLPSRHAAILGEFQARKLAPTIDVRRTDPLNRYAMVAAALALKDSRLEVRAANSERVGMVMCLNYGSLAVQERFRDSLAKDGLEKMSAKHFPSMVVSTVGGTVSQAFNLRGVNSTIVDGITGGLQGFIHAAEVMQGNPDLDAMVVVAADEISPLLFRVFNQRGWLAATNDDEHPFLNAYRTGNQGWLLGEGGAALILERASTAKARGAKPLAILGGYGLSADAVLAPEVEPTGQWYRQAIDAALHDAAIQSANVDLVYGHGRGEALHDARELRVFEQLFANRNIPIGNVMENVGVCAASSGLLSLIAGGLSLQHGEAYPVVGSLPVSNSPVSNSAVRFIDTCAQLAIANVLVAGSTENGNNAAVVLKSVEATV